MCVCNALLSHKRQCIPIKETSMPLRMFRLEIFHSMICNGTNVPRVSRRSSENAFSAGTSPKVLKKGQKVKVLLIMWGTMSLFHICQFSAKQGKLANIIVINTTCTDLDGCVMSAMWHHAWLKTLTVSKNFTLTKNNFQAKKLCYCFISIKFSILNNLYSEETSKGGIILIFFFVLIFFIYIISNNSIR